MRHSILVVDDSGFNIKVLEKELEEHYEVLSATDPMEALRIAFEKKPSLILLDVMMPKMNGYELCKVLKGSKKTSNIPVVFLTSKGEVEDKVTGLQMGGDDYITKPYEVSELLARIRVHIRLKETQDQLKQLLEEKTRLIEQLENLSLHDGLTGVYNRRFLEEYLERSVEECKRYELALSVIMVDIDHFKDVNDTYGHQVGDAVLKKFAKRLGENIRRTDMLARYGGEEFTIVLRNTDVEGAVVLAEKLRTAVQEKPFEVDGHSISLMISLGVAGMKPGDYMDAAQLLREADILLYRAKDAGRNRVEY
ncbi:MAG: diguanylate cyclase [Clostridiales bacterium]|nr:diguanylate cyclase [Clostridiales bacterium]